jgi:hypothetical protein
VIGWLIFVCAQLVMLAAQLVGLVLLIPFCLAQDWTLDQHSVKDGRPVDRWTFGPLNYVYGNPEDGVSGQTALIWDNAGHLVPYMPGAWAPWRAYCWSAWRNSSDNLKYVFHWEGGPFINWTNGKWYIHAGWDSRGLPGLSAGRV